NFVTFGYAAVHGTSGIIAKLLALPTFCLVVVFVRLVQCGLPRLGLPELRTMFGLKLLFLVVGAALAILFGPFSDSDSQWALATGMSLVAAMAIQNAVHRIYLSDAPPSTLMTGTSTQMMVDIADFIRGLPRDRRPQVEARLRKLVFAVLAFALGCG